MPANVILDPPYAEGLEGELAGPYWQPIVDSLRAAGCRVARFTDEATPSKVNCDLLVNDHPRAAGFKTAYESFGFTGRLLAGPEYFLIDAGHKFPETESVSAEESLFVSFGGADQLGLVERFEAGLREICKEVRTNLVIGPGSVEVEFDIPNLNVHRALPPAEFASLLRHARMAVTASGNTMFERVFHGVPGLSVSQSAHQQNLGEEFEGFGVTRHLGRGDAVSADWFAASVRALWNDDTALRAQGEACRSMDVEGGCRAIVEAVAAL